MFKILKADKDSYIQNRVISGLPAVSGNVGDASSLDLFKCYGLTFSGLNPNIELSRLLIHFNLDPLRSLISSSKIDINDDSFNCQLKLFDVFAGQPTPQNFIVVVNPLSRSFDEGLGRDVVLYSDNDVCNFLSGSRTQGSWILSGAGQGGSNGTNVDYLTSYSGGDLTSTQLFKTGAEDLLVDVTSAVSAALLNLIPDQGFRIALTGSLEDDLHTYFVKRFASRQAFNTSKHPQLIVRFDDSVIDDSTNLRLDTSSSLIIYNYDSSGLANIVSGSTQLTGSNCLLLRLATPISGGVTSFSTFASQVKLGEILLTGVYSASISIPSNHPDVIEKISQSGSVEFTSYWSSIDGTIGYVTGSNTFFPSLRGGTNQATKRYAVTATGFQDDIINTDIPIIRINVFDKTSPAIKLVKTPTLLPGLSIRDVHYRIRDVSTNENIIDFDTTYNSTRCSSDNLGCFFPLDASNLIVGRSYVIDVLIESFSGFQTYLGVSQTFKVST